MNSPRTYQTQAIVIKQIKIGESDKLLTIYTPEFGKLKTVAKGAYRPASKLGGNVEPLTHSLLFLARGRKLDIITQSQTIDSFLELKSNLWRLSHGFYILELVDLFTMENNANCSLFDLLLDTLHRINMADNDEIMLRYFEFHLLSYLGYHPQLQRCVSCNSQLRPLANFLSPSQGGVLCPSCGQKESAAYLLSVDALKVLRLWENCDYATARRVKLKPNLSLELQQVLQDYIRYYLQQEVKSTLWLEELKNLSNG